MGLPLDDAGILKEIKSGRKNIFAPPKYIELLTDEENIWVLYASIETETAVPD